MAPAGDYDSLASILEFFLQTLPLVQARTLHYFGHPGVFYTETKSLFGLFAIDDYGINSSLRNASDPPYWLQFNDYIKYDYGGNSGGPEVALMVFEHFLYSHNETSLARYLPIVTNTLDFFWHH